MSVASTTPNGTVRHWVVNLTEPTGEFTIQVVGVPELRVTAATHAEAIEQIRAMLRDWQDRGRLMAVEVASANPLLHFPGHLDPTDPVEQEFVEELARRRQEDLEHTLREDGRGCSNSSSTPTT